MGEAQGGLRRVKVVGFHHANHEGIANLYFYYCIIVIAFESSDHHQ